MNKATFLCFLVFLASHAAAQDADPLAVTLPNGKTVHFQTADQKAKFLAARERAASTAVPSPPAATPSQPTASTPKPAASTASTGTGKVNVNAPTFSADYYMFAPETWEGKPVTISVAYVRRSESASRTDGLVELEAFTYGPPTSGGEQRSGGQITLVATPPAAQRIITLAGTGLQYTGWGYKTSVFKGIFKKSEVGTKGWFVYVDK